MDKQKISQKDKYIYIWLKINNYILNMIPFILHKSVFLKKRSEHRRQTDENLDNVYPRVLKYLIYLSLKEAEKHDKVLF